MDNTNGGYGGLTKFSSSGSVLLNMDTNIPSQGLGFCISGLPYGMAIDGSGNVWVTGGNYPECVVKVSNAGSILSGPNGYTGGGLDYPDGMAMDGSGNAWVANADESASQFSSTGSALSGINGYSIGSVCCLNSIAVDGSGNAWSAAGSSSVLVKLSNTGANLSGTTGFSGGGLRTPGQIAIDGSGNVWVANGSASPPSPDMFGSLSEFSAVGLPISGTTGYIGAISGGNPGSVYYPKGLAIDGSGNVWMANANPLSNNAFLTEFIGAATPVITPIAAGLPVTPTANGSSNLGTRP